MVYRLQFSMFIYKPETVAGTEVVWISSVIIASTITASFSSGISLFRLWIGFKWLGDERVTIKIDSESIVGVVERSKLAFFNHDNWTPENLSSSLWKSLKLIKINK